jgi:hypothetical protein
VTQEQCSDVVRHEEEIRHLWGALEKKTDSLRGHIDTKFSELEARLLMRLPPWVTLIISVLTFLLGCSVTIIGMLSR